MAKISCVDAQGNKHEFEESEYLERPSVYGMCLQDGKIVLAKDKWSYKWGIPGGAIDENETSFQALQREFLEETGLEISSNVKQILRDVTYFLGDGEEKPWKTLRFVYFVNSVGGILKEHGNIDELVEVKYFPIPKAIELLKKTKNNLPIADLLGALPEAN